jgi:protein-disulfide isomerase
MLANAAHEVYKQKGNAGFWKFHGLLFSKQGTPDAFTRANVEKYAEEMGGIDLAKFKKALDTDAHKDFVKVDSDAADKAGISGTPAFVINGYFISGAQPYAKFKKLIDKALKEAGDTKGGATPVEKPADKAGAKPAKAGGAKKGDDYE